jgi:hypothetical protein
LYYNKCHFRNEYFQFNDEDTTELTDNDDELEPVYIGNELNDDRLTSKWLGCANHTLQLALKSLDANEKFLDISAGICGILRGIARSSVATRNFRALNNRSIVLPNATR